MSAKAADTFSFTIHFATINTYEVEKEDRLLLLFTIHFATINTSGILTIYANESKFTIHFATINTEDYKKIQQS